MKEKLIQAINLEKREHPGTPVLLADLRKRLTWMRKVLFDRAIIELAKSGRYSLSKCFSPESSTKAELSLMTPDGQGGYYYTINPKDDAAAEPAPTPLSQGQIRSGKTPSPQKDIPDAGNLSTRKRGRPPLSENIRRVQIRPGYRVPAWVALWMKEQGDIGKVIETAVVGFYGLTPPKP
jgi:hypothetical protein